MTSIPRAGPLNRYLLHEPSVRTSREKNHVETSNVLILSSGFGSPCCFCQNLNEKNPVSTPFFCGEGSSELRQATNVNLHHLERLIYK
jgi:hypothetical protein